MYGVSCTGLCLRQGQEQELVGRPKEAGRSVGQSAGRRRRELNGKGGAGDRPRRGINPDAVVLPVPS